MSRKRITFQQKKTLYWQKNNTYVIIQGKTKKERSMKVKIDRWRFRGAISEFGQKNLAEALGTKQPGISRMLKNVDKLTFERFNQICEAIRVNPKDFVIFEDKNKIAA